MAERRAARRGVLVEPVGGVGAGDVDAAGPGKLVVGPRVRGDLPRRVEGKAPLVVVAARGQVVDQQIEPPDRVIAIARGKRPVERAAPTSRVIGITRNRGGARAQDRGRPVRAITHPRKAL